jgi:hypothetical protein
MISHKNLKMQYVDNLDQTGLISDKVFALGNHYFDCNEFFHFFLLQTQICINKSVTFDSRISPEKIIFS